MTNRFSYRLHMGIMACLSLVTIGCDDGTGGSRTGTDAIAGDGPTDAAGDTGAGVDVGGGGGVAGNGGSRDAGMLDAVTGSGGAPGSGGDGSGGRQGSGGIGSGGAGFGTGGTVGKPTAYLAGDSTVQTYSAAQAPRQGWGQRIAEHFTTDVVFVNKAMGGRSSKSYVDEGRLDEILRLLEPGDYLFAQWGINDRYASDPTRYTNPATTFRQYLKKYVDGARSKGAIPVLVTPTPRLHYEGGVFHNDFPEYCKAIKEVGAETKTTVIDLQSKGLAYYTSIGYDQVSSKIALDVLHFKTEGAFQMARLVAEGVKESDLYVAKFVK